MYNADAPQQPHVSSSPAPTKHDLPEGDDVPHKDSPMNDDQPIEALDKQADEDLREQEELMRKTAKKQALENERPCLFKSLSPVGSIS
jgi:glutamine amidotransferase